MLAVSALVASTAAHADNYSDVMQLLKSGKSADALTKVEQHLKTNPNDPQMRFLRGVAQSDSGKANDAIATFTKLSEEYPELPEPYNNLAVLYANQNQLDKARTALEMAIRTNPSYSTAHENLGDIYAKLAGQAYNKALQLDNNNNSLKPKLALIREMFTPGAARATNVAAATPAPAAKPTAAAPAPAAPAPAPATTVAAAKPAPAAAPAAPAPAPAPAAAAPAKPAAPAAPAVAANDDGDKQDINARVQAWAKAWAGKDMGDYLGAYGASFKPAGGQSRAAWEKERRARIVGKSKISVNVSDLSVDVAGDKATARFRQDYRADSLNVSSRKTLDLAKVNGRWVIVRESTGR